MSQARAKQVSFDDEPLIVVDEENNVLEYRAKADVHAGEGILHRAFSVFLFDAEGRLLLQQRSASKPLGRARGSAAELVIELQHLIVVFV